MPKFLSFWKIIIGSDEIYIKYHNISDEKDAYIVHYLLRSLVKLNIISYSDSISK